MFKLIFLLAIFISDSFTYEVTTIPAGNVFGDSPHWDVKTQSLYYADIFNKVYDIYRYDYSENKMYAAKVLGETNVSFIIPVKGCKDQFAIGTSNRIVKIIRWDGRSNTAIVLRNVFAVEQDPSYSNNRWHISKIGPKGRFFYGGMFKETLCSQSSNPNASFYRYSKRGGLERVMGQLQISNGFDWNVKAKKFYHIDGCKFGIREYDWQPKTGKLCNGRNVYSFDNGNGIPTSTGLGLAIDCVGNLFAGIYNGSAVHIIDPRNSQFLGMIDLSTEIITAVAFGGPKMDILFVLSSSLPLNIYTGQSTNGMLSSSAGSLFMVDGLGTKGFAPKKFIF